MTPSRMLTFDGITQSVTEWALDYGITPDTIYRRLRMGWSVSRAITTPIPAKPGDKLSGAYLDTLADDQPAKPRKVTDIYITLNGKERSLSEWAKVTGIKHATLRHRFKQGWSAERILTEPVSKNSRIRPGVVSNIAPSDGTGVGSDAQETPKIDFSTKEVKA